MATYYRSVAFEETRSSNSLPISPITLNGSFAKKDLVKLTPYKSMKSIKRKANHQRIGAILLATGLVTAANYFVPSDKSSKNRILLSGGIQMGVGISFLISGFSKAKGYEFRGDGDVWSVR